MASNSTCNSDNRKVFQVCNHRAVVLLLFMVLMGAAACQPMQPPAPATTEAITPASTSEPTLTSTATTPPTATIPLTATATLQPTVTPQPAPTATLTSHGDPLLPEPCRPDRGNGVYIRSEDAFCFSIPERFKIQESAPGHAIIVGPALEKTADPIFASLEVTATEVPAGSSLNDLVEEALREFDDFTAWKIVRTPVQVDGEPAVSVEPVPGRLSSRHLYFLHKGTFYKLSFWPVDAKLAQADLSELFTTVTNSFRFLPARQAQAETGKRITGRVLWGNDSVPGGRVELRMPDWRTNPDSLIMKTVADGSGAYVLTNPPVGAYEVVPAWPEGVTDGTLLAPGMPVTVAAGQEVTGVDVWLAKKLKLLEPAAGSEVGATPTLRWEAFPNARFYRVIVTDFATMEGFVGEDTAETSLTLATPLPAGRKLTWVVNALDAQMGLLAEDTIEFTVKKSP
jgi:hypothetical protein